MTRKGLKRSASAPADMSLNSNDHLLKIVGSKHLVYHREKFPCKTNKLIMKIRFIHPLYRFGRNY